MNKDNKWGDMTSLRMSAESLADAINMRVRAENRVRAGNADIMPGTEPRLLSKEEIRSHYIVQAAQSFEDTMRANLTVQYHANVPLKVREWASETPILASGELFPRIVGLVGNPRHAVPLKMEGTGKDRKPVPDGDPYDRSLRQLWQFCGCGDPDLVPEKGNQALLLRRGKMTTVRPLLFTFSERLQMAKGKVNVSQHPMTKILLDAKESAQGKRHYKTCRNTHRPPMKSNGCGIVAHPEWGEPGSEWRDGHKQAHAFRIVQKELLRQYYIASEGTEW